MRSMTVPSFPRVVRFRRIPKIAQSIGSDDCGEGFHQVWSSAVRWLRTSLLITGTPTTSTEEVRDLLGRERALRSAVNDDAVEAVVDEGGQVAEQLGERFHGDPRTARSGRKTMKRGQGRQIVEGKRFRLADEERYVQRRATHYDSRIVTIGRLIRISTKTSDAWPLDPARSVPPQGWLERARASPSESREPIPRSRSVGRPLPRRGPASVYSDDGHRPVRHHPRLPDQQAHPGRFNREISK